MSDDDSDVGLPQKGLNLIIKDALPDMRIATETRDLLNHCCIEFIKYISREAQRICAQEQRKTILHTDLQRALLNLGFGTDYLEACDAVLDECAVTAEKRLMRKNSRLDRCGIPEEELLRIQQELIEKAREDLEKQAASGTEGDPQEDSLRTALASSLTTTNHNGNGADDEEEEDYDAE